MDAESESVAMVPSEKALFDFETVFQANYVRIARVISRIIKDSARAEDLSVEVFQKLLCASKVTYAEVTGWLYRTAVNGALDELRKECRREKYERLFSLSRADESLEPAPEQQDRVRKTLAAMKGRAAEMLILQSEGFSYQEIAEALKVSPASIGTLIIRAKQSFRKEYIKRYGQP